jgi:hypothetical protein
MHRIVSKLAAISALVLSAAAYSASAASAATVTYSFVNASETFGANGTSDFSGTFGYNTSTEAIITPISINVTGFLAGSYTVLTNAGGADPSGFEIAVTSASTGDGFALYFQNFFGTGVSPNNITNAYYTTSGNCCSVGNIDSSVTGYVQTTPLPATITLFTTGLGVIGLLARRSKRKAAAIAA